MQYLSICYTEVIFLPANALTLVIPIKKTCSFPKGLDPWILSATEEWIIKKQPRVAAPFENEKQEKSVSRNKNTLILFFRKCNYSDIHDGKSTSEHINHLCQNFSPNSLN